MSDFKSLGLNPQLTAVLQELKFLEPTNIQLKSIPPLLEGKDLVGHSKTGSGKTAAYALPILQTLDIEQRCVQALILCPTRELCAQVAREIRTFGRKLGGLHVVIVSGGQPIRAQIDTLERGAHIVVGTPGRMLDHMLRNSIDLNHVATVILDEADRMLDMGFQNDVEKILEGTPESRQLILFSATFPKAIEALSKRHQKNAIRVTIDEGGDSVPEIRQLALVAPLEDKEKSLYWALHEFAHDSAIIFCNFKASVNNLRIRLRGAGLSVDCLHGGLDQFNRDQVLARFRNRSIRILIATDVAGRGIDVEKLDLVINYEMPDQPEIYLHRIGRTGRAGSSGVSVALATPKDKRKLDAIETLTGRPLESCSLPSGIDVKELAKRLAQDASMATLLISGGRKDKIRPGDILGALTGGSGGLQGQDIGKIEIHDRISYVAVAKQHASHAAKSLDQGRIKKKRFRATLIE